MSLGTVSTVVCSAEVIASMFLLLWLWSFSFIQVLLKSHSLFLLPSLSFLFVCSEIKTLPNQCFQANPLDPFPHEELESVSLSLSCSLCFLLRFLLLSASSDHKMSFLGRTMVMVGSKIRRILCWMLIWRIEPLNMYFITENWCRKEKDAKEGN